MGLTKLGKDLPLDIPDIPLAVGQDSILVSITQLPSCPIAKFPGKLEYFIDDWTVA